MCDVSVETTVGFVFTLFTSLSPVFSHGVSKLLHAIYIYSSLDLNGKGAAQF